VQYSTNQRRKNRHRILKKRKIPGLFEFIISASFGKTTLSSELGVLDVDQLTCLTTTSYLTNMRSEATRTKSFNWLKHNSIWYTNLLRVLGMLMYDSEECAVMIGVLLIGYARLKPEVHGDAISNRDNTSQLLSIKN